MNFKARGTRARVEVDEIDGRLQSRRRSSGCQDRRDEVQSLHRALDVLFLVATYERSISAAEIAAAVGLPRPTVYRIVNTFASRGLVAWHRREVRATPKLYLMTAGGPRTFRLAELIDPYLMRLVELSAETAGLHERLGYLRRTVHEIAGLHDLDPARGVGFTAPMWLGAVGHVLLAGLREDELEQLLDRVTFPRLTTHSVRDRAELLDKVAAARERGWSSSNSETVEGVCGAAAPLKQNGRTVAALLLCGPSEREPVIKGWVPELVRVARDASHAWTAVTSPDTGGVASPAGRVRHADRLDRSASALQPVRPTATANEGFGEGFTSRDDGETVRADASSPRA